MRSFIVLCFVAVASAQYNYEPAGPAEDVLSGSADLSAPISPAIGEDVGATYTSPPVAPQVDFEKEFYTFSANDNDFNNIGAQQASNSLKKGIRVIFIKGPENHGLEDAAVALAKQANQQQTAIYVLNKQADIGDLANKLNNINHIGNSRPEVHFVKYRTPEDAANAQRAIQSQYDSLGGNTRTINGGVAPVLNFASQAPASTNFGSGASFKAPAAAPSNTYAPLAAPSNTYIAAAPASTPAASTVVDPDTSYLPASILRLFRL